MQRSFSQCFPRIPLLHNFPIFGLVPKLFINGTCQKKPLACFCRYCLPPPKKKKPNQNKSLRIGTCFVNELTCLFCWRDWPWMLIMPKFPTVAPKFLKHLSTMWNGTPSPAGVYSCFKITVNPIRRPLSLKDIRYWNSDSTQSHTRLFDTGLSWAPGQLLYERRSRR